MQTEVQPHDQRVGEHDRFAGRVAVEQREDAREGEGQPFLPKPFADQRLDEREKIPGG